MSMKINSPSPNPQTIQPQHKPVVQHQPASTSSKPAQNPLQQDMLVQAKTHALAPQSAAAGGKLEDSPQFKNSYARASLSDRQLLDSLKDTPNASNAFATYQTLRGGAQDPNRLSDNMIKDMVLGVANPRSPTHNNSEGLLSQAHAQNAKAALLNMPPEQFNKFNSTYQSAGTGAGAGPQPGSDPATERQLLLKALGARSGAVSGGNPALADKAMGEITEFGKSINGSNAEQLKQDTTVLETDKGWGYAQQGKMSCSAAVKMTMLAENDPIYARSVRQNSDVKNKSIENTLLQSQGGTTETGLNAEGISGLYNQHGVDPNLSYKSKLLAPGGLSGEVNAIADAVGKGYDVPMAVKFGDGGGHAMNICGVDSGKPGNRIFTVHDSAGGGAGLASKGGVTRQVAEKDLLDGSFLSKHFGYAPDKSQGAHVFNVQMPSYNKPLDPAMQQMSQNLGVVNQQQVDQGLINAAKQKNGQYLAENNKAKPPEPQQSTVYNPDIDDDISIEDKGFGIED